MHVIITPYHVASRGKEGSPAATKADKAAVSSLDYTDIPVSQIRKVNWYPYIIAPIPLEHMISIYVCFSLGFPELYQPFSISRLVEKPCLHLIFML